MILKHKYVIGCNVMFYEIEMLPEYIHSIIEAAKNVENKDNIYIHIDWNCQNYLEQVDDNHTGLGLSQKLNEQLVLLDNAGFKNCNTVSYYKGKFFNIAQHRRNLNTAYCEIVDFVIWGETDSMFPAELFDVVERVSEVSEQNNNHKYIINFADRKNWDPSWDIVTHPDFENIKYVDEKDWLITNEASSKSYMTYERMCEINSKVGDYDVRILNEPKFDGSCLVITSDLIKSGVNIPIAVTHCAEDTAFGKMAKLIMGDAFIQYCIKNILRVHNRRHPKKRMYIKGENNPLGFVGKDKGDWWDILEKTSKYNVDRLIQSQEKFITMDAILNDINKVRLK